MTKTRSPPVPAYFVNFGLQFTGVQCDEQLSLEEVGELVLPRKKYIKV